MPCLLFLCLLGSIAVVYIGLKWNKALRESLTRPEEDDDFNPADLVILDCLLHGDDPFDH